MRLPVILAISAVIASYAATAAAQSPPSAGDIGTRNPLLNQVAQVDPDVLNSLLARLSAIRGSPSRQGAARGDPPTDSEQREIAANPIFAEAFAKSPDETIGVLRQVNLFLRAGGKPDSGH